MMTKRQINCVKKAIEHTRNAIKGNGFYMPSDAQTDALKALYAETYGTIGKREYGRFSAYLMSIDTANANEVYAVCADEKQLAAVESALAAYYDAHKQPKEA